MAPPIGRLLGRTPGCVGRSWRVWNGRPSWQAGAVRAYLITGNPGSGKSTLAVELSRRGEMALDADELAWWADCSGMPVEPPEPVDEAWQLGHRWVWNRGRIEAAIHAHRAGNV
jgi:hypothetical protein